MKNNKGITLISLTMYVVAFAILAGIVATITSFFYTNVTDLRESTDSLGEFEKFNAAFLEDIKEKDNKILSIENDDDKKTARITFSNGAVFSFESGSIYSNNIRICENVSECQFKVKENTVKPAISVYLVIGDDFAKTLDYVMNSNEVMVEDTNDRVILTPSTREWTQGPVMVALSCNNIPDGYVLQYKLNGGEWTNYDENKEVEVAEYNTIVYGRLNNGTDSKGENTLTINNIDKENPNAPTNVLITKGENSVTVSAGGGTDRLSGVAGYQYRIGEDVDWSEVKTSDASYTFEGIELGKEYTLYVRTVDNVGLTSEKNLEEVFMIPIKVAEITLEDQTLTKTDSTDPTLEIIPTIAPTNATNQSVTWKSSNTSVATVSSSGVVTYVAAGTATITATAKDGSGVKGTCTITCVEAIKVTKITLANKTLTKTSTTTSPTATITPTIAPTNATNKSVTWKSSNTSVATVSSSGVVTYKSNGTATITCTASDGSGISGTCTVTCTSVKVTSITLANKTLTKTSTTTSPTATITPTIAPTNAADQTVTWKSSDTSVATVSSAGKVTYVAAGTATITATAKDGSGVSGTCTVTCKEQKVTGITLSNKTLTKTSSTNPTVTLSPTITPTNAVNQTVTWKSSDTSVATVSSSGVVTYVAAGTATITATAKDGSGVKGTCTITCVEAIKVTGITLANKTLTKTSTATTNPTATITPTIAPTNATNQSVTWTSSDTSVATVSSSGVVTYKGIGKATITATAKDGSGVKGTCTVTCRYKYTDVYTAEFSGNRTQIETITKTTNITLDLTGVSKISFEYYGEVMTSGSTLLGTHTLTHFVGSTSKNTLNLGSTGDGTGAHSWVTKTMTITGGSSSSKLQLKAVGTTESTWYYVAFKAKIRNIILIP